MTISSAGGIKIKREDGRDGASYTYLYILLVVDGFGFGIQIGNVGLFGAVEVGEIR
jgi:hypothetical protein